MKKATINFETLAVAIESGNVDIRFALHWTALGAVAEAVYRDLDINSTLGVTRCAFLEQHPCVESLSYRRSRAVNSLLTAIRALMRVSSETARAGMGRLLTEFVDTNDTQQTRSVIYSFAEFFGGPEQFLRMYWEHTDTFIDGNYNKYFLI